MYDIPTDGCNIEIMGYPFFAESVSPNEAFRRREYNFNNLVGGTMKVSPGAYVPLDFSITTHVPVDPDRPDIHNSIFQEMMSQPVEVISPELGGRFNAIVIIKPSHDKLDYLKLDIGIREVPDAESLIPGEEFTVPASRVVTEDTTQTQNTTTSTDDSNKLQTVVQNSNITSKVNSITKKNKGSE